ncbi:MAG TPA: class I SAM-dependent methyltransferase [Solirubrobacteraceae bacterium]|jgi:SAM-dependent methyltransferase|nr:class I SAM-dependent methyltransferase [Solirubrobacteraceae bacterium]
MSDFDPEQYRQQSVEQWEAAAAGWSRRQEQMQRFAQPVTEWLLDALELARGERVLDLAAGLGDVGLAAAEGMGSSVSVLIADQAEPMLHHARQRAQEMEVENVDFKRMNAEWIDLPLGSVDAVACRFGLMLMADPDAALRECRRVLRAGGRIALAVWDSPARNPWASAPGMVLSERGLMQLPGPVPGSFRPGMFALADPDALAERLQDAGFTDVAVESLPLTRAHGDFEDFWETTLDMSPGFHDAVMSCPPTEIEQIKEAVAGSLTRFTAVDGALEIPAAVLGARASA